MNASHPYAQANQKRPLFWSKFIRTAYFLLALLLLVQCPLVGIAQCVSSSTLTAALTSGTDDATQSGADVVTETSSLTFGGQYVGLHFPSVYIPKSATITSAYIQFMGSSPATGGTVSNVGIRGHNVANSSAFTTATGSSELSTRYLSAPTSSSVSWSESNPWTSGFQGASTPNLAAIVQEIISRSDWKPNNPITILFDATSASSGPSARSYDDPLHKAPRLVITFKAATSLSIIPTVSGCFNTTAGSRATVSTEIRWTDAPANDSLIIMLGSQRWSIMPGIDTVSFSDGGDLPYKTQVQFEFASPQVVTFRIPADGSAGTVTTFFKSNSACSASAPYTAPAACPPFVCTPGTDLSGIAFNDFNADGVKNGGETVGVAGVTVKAYDCAGVVYTATTDANGQYKLTIPVANYPVRVEFTNLPAGYLAQGTPNGTGGHTTVQFVKTPDCGVNLGMSDPTNYCQTNPKIFVPCYISGNPTDPATTSAGNLPTFVSVNYADYSIATSSNTYSNLANPQTIATAKQVGSLWGTVYNRQTKTIFTSAVLRRQSGLGPSGLGGIYSIKPETNTVTPFLDVTTIGINVGSASVGSNIDRGLSGNPLTNSHDSTAFSQVGKYGIGGLTLSSNGTKLYFVNLFDRKVYGLDITTGTAPTTYTSFPIPSGCSVGSNARPWAIKYNKGKVYVGVICDGAVSDNRSDLRAFIYALDPATSTWSTALDFPLTYPKGPSVLFDNPDNGTTSSNWRTWTDTFSQVVNTDGYYLTRSQPILSAIEFDVDNSIIMAFANRTSLQGGADSYGTGAKDANLYYTISGGDILRASNKSGIYTLENNARTGGVTGSFPNNNQGPGLGEFYDDNFYHYTILGFAENALGGLAFRPGSGNIVTSSMSPLNEFQDGTAGYGFRQLSNTTGAVQSAYIVYQDNSSQKSVNLGDFDLGCSMPAFLEIGNRVWIDTDNDGLQDPCESALAGVNVSLYKSGTLLATTLTNNAGEYYFSSKSKLTSGTWSGTGADTTLLPNTAYQVAFGNGQFTNNGLTVGNFRYQPATALSSAPTASTLNDSNVQLATIGNITLPVANVTTGDPGSVNHTIDAGFVCLPPLVATLSATPASCAGPSASPNSARINLSGIQNGEKAYLYTTGPAPSYTAIGGQPISASAVSFTGLADPGTSAGQSYSIIVYNSPSCSTIVTVNLPQAVCGPCAMTLTANPQNCQSATNSYAVTGTISLTSAVPGTITVVDGSTTATFPVTVGQTSVPYSLSGLLPGTGIHTITATLPNCSTATITYSAPASCTVAPVCSISAVATQSFCQTATNTFSNTVVVTVNNPTAGSIIIADGTQTATFSTTINTLNTFTAVFPLIISNGANRTVTTTLPGCSTILTTYTAPISCSAAPVCSLTAVATAGICASATNTYSANVVVNLTNASSGTLSVSIPGAAPVSQTLAVGTTSLTIVVPGLNSDGVIHTATISLPGCGSTTANYTAPASCSSAPMCSLTAVATGGICTSATNMYSASVIVNLTNASSGTLSVSIPGAAPVSQTVAAGTTSLTMVVPGLTSDGVIHTATINLPGCGTTTANYTAPASCSVAPVCSLTAAATAGICASATNTYSANVVVYLTNTSSGTLLVNIPGAAPVSQTLAAGTSSLTVVVPGLTSDGVIHTATISLPSCATTTANYSAPISCSVAPPVCALSATVTPGSCVSATNTFTTTIKINITNPVAGTLSVTDGTLGQTIVITAGTGVVTYTAFFSGIISDGASHTVTASLPGCSTISTPYTAPGSCTQPTGTQLSIDKIVNKTKAKTGEILTYTLILTNAGSTTATHVVVRDSSSTGLRYVANSATAPAGTTFTQGSPISTWTVGTIAPAQSLSLTFQASIDSTGILYNQATIPGDTATACTSVPILVCTGDTYIFRLTAPLGRTSYKWYRNGVQLANQTTATLDVTTPGSYSLAADSTAGRCPSFSCCPLIVEEDILPTFQATAIPVSCSANLAQANGQIVLSNFRTGYTYQYSAGGTFNENNPLSGAAQAIPANGIIVANLANPTSAQAYTIRVYNSSGCYTDVTASLSPITCSCSLTATATAGICASATNTYSANVVVNLPNASSGTLLVSIPGAAPVSQTLVAGTTSLTVVVPGLTSDGAIHTATVSLTSCGTTTANYTAPVSCSVAPICSLIAVATAGVCTSATNTYSANVVVNLTNASSGTLSVSIPGAAPVSQTLAAGTTSLTVVVPGLTSDGVIHMATISLPACGTTTATYMAPASCSVAPVPVCSLTAAATAGICASATNTYSANVVVNLTNASSGTLSVSIPGAAPVSQTLATGVTSLTVVVPGLNSDGLIHTATIGLPGCGTTTANYTAPASCSVAPAPVCSLIAVATAGICASATNTYSANVVVNLTNASSGTLSVSIPGAAPVSQTLMAGTTSLTVVVPGLTSDGATHTATISLPGCSTTTAGYSAPASCSAAPVCSLTATATTGSCTAVNNTYSANVVVNLTNASSGTLSVSIPGAAPVSQTLAAGTTSLTIVVPGLNSDGVIHTATINLPGCGTTTANYTAPAPCSVAPAPVCSLTAAATAGMCAWATNTYSANVAVNLTNASSGTITVSIPGAAPVSQTLSAGTTSLIVIIPGLTSDGAIHTATISLPGCATTTATYMAPTSCSIGVGLSLSDPPQCVPGTNTYNTTGIVSFTNAINGPLTITDGSSTTTIAVTTGTTSVAYSFSGLTTGTGTHTVVVTYMNQLVSTTYTAPAACPAPICSLTAMATAGICSTATNTHSVTAVVTLSNSTTGTLTVIDGPRSATFAITSVGSATIAAIFNDMPSDGLTHTVVASLPGCSTITTGYAAPPSCSVVCSLSVTASARPVTCSGIIAQANGKIVVGSFTTGDTYQYSFGSTFNPGASLSGAAQTIPVGGSIVSNLANPATGQAYTVRVYKAGTPSCYKDITVLLMPTICGCPADICVPFVITQTKRSKRIGDPR